jgi:hypothetical protein
VFLAIDTSGGGLKKIARSAIVSGLATSGAISNVVEDSSPQLGGDLDVNSNGLVSTSNGNIALTPNGTGVVRVDGSNGIDMESGAISIKNSGAESYVRFYCESSNAHYTQLQAAPHSAYSGNVTVVLPASADTLVGRATTDTLTNKTLTTPVIAEIDSGSTITLDATTDIVLDADGGDIFFKDAGTTFGSATNTSGNLIIKSGTTTALTFSGANITAAGNLSVSGDLDVTGTLDLSDSNFTNVGSLQLDSIAGDGDTNTAITFSGSDVITVSAGGDNQVTFTNGAIVPSTDNDIDLGTSSTEFKDAFFDGTVTTDGLTVSGTPSFAAGTIALTGLDIDGGTDISADLTTSDLIIVDDGAGGTNRKAALSRVVTLVSANIDDPTALAIALG